MINVTVLLPDDEYEVDTYPNAVDMGVDSRDRLFIYAGTRGESGVISRSGTIAMYPGGHWARAWVDGQEATDDSYTDDTAPTASVKMDFTGHAIPANL